MSVAVDISSPSSEPIECYPWVTEQALQFIPDERGLEAGKEEEGVTTPADLETPRLSVESDDTDPEDSTSSGVVDPLRLLGLSVIQQAIVDGATHWFFSSYSRASFEFWCSVAKLQPRWVQRKVSESKPSHCPGLRKVGKVWWLDIYQGHQRQRIRIGNMDSEAALQLALGRREAIKQNGKVMAAGT